jgi:hypothetical protein
MNSHPIVVHSFTIPLHVGGFRPEISVRFISRRHSAHIPFAVSACSAEYNRSR